MYWCLPLQYGARDKFLSGVASERTVSEAAAIAASAGSESEDESRASHCKFVTETLAIRCERSSRETSLKLH